MGKFTLRPSKKFKALITLHGSVNAAVTEWGVPYMTVKDWMKGDGQLPGNVIARIVEITGHTYEELFDHHGCGKRKAKR